MQLCMYVGLYVFYVILYYAFHIQGILLIVVVPIVLLFLLALTCYCQRRVKSLCGIRDENAYRVAS
jgi:hypothetical protein